MIESTLSAALASATTYQQKAKIVWDHYLSRQLPEMSEGRMDVGAFEPNWIHSGYDLVRKFVAGEKLATDEIHLLDQIITSHCLKDGFAVAAFPGQPKGPMRIIHDGWKAGTPSWIFMGRSFPGCTIHLGADWFAVKRTLPEEFYKEMDQNAAPPTLWMAYHKDKQMGLTALTSNVIGPAISYEDIWNAVNDEVLKTGEGPLYKNA